jgi:nucleoside-triphosphatase
MGSFLFLEGDSGEGKTTLLFKCLQSYKKKIGGFYSQKLINATGDTRGFRMIPASEAWIPSLPYQKGISNVFIEKTETGWEKRLEFFDTEGVNMLSIGKEQKLILMDEIGGVELLSSKFMNAFYQCIDGDFPCIGVIKSRKNFQSMSTRVPVKSEAKSRLLELEEELKSRSWGKILTFKRRNEEHLHKEIITFLKQNVD